MTVNIDSADVRIIPECSERIVVTEANPGYSDAGVSRDRAITVTFSKKPSKSSFIFSESEIPADATNKKAVFDDEKNEVSGEFWAYTLGGQTYLKNVSITNSDGISLAEHFLQPELDGNILTVPVDRSNSIEIESGSSLTIVVTISDGVCDDNGVTMNGEKQWRYRATEATDEKATLTLSCENDEGSVYLAGTRDYNISQKITLSFTENADYQFLRWNYDSKIVNIAEPDKINTTAIVVEKTDASEIKAVCAKRLRVSSFSPKIDDKTPSVSKNSSIIITFDHDLPTDAEGYAQLSNISIAVGGSPVKSSFLEPVINGSSVTFAADKTNMLEVPGDQTKTVTVSVPADFFYKTDDGAKVTFGGNGEVFNYKIDSTTLEKAEITFGAAKDSGAITPSAGTYHYSIGSEIPLSFALSEGWQFNGWSVSGADQNVADKIKIADEKALSTKLSVYEALQGVRVTAKTSECLRVTETSPSAKTNPKDSSIIITFNKPLAGDCSSLLNKIRVSSDGNSLDSYYTDRSISEISGDNGDFKQITIKNTSYLSVPKNSTKIITLTVPSDFYYNDGETKINLAEDSFSFTIDHTTEAKTGITYKVVNGEDGSSLSAGTINRSSYEEYNIGEEVELSLDLYSGYQFYGWDITDSSGYSVTDQISYVNSNSSYLAPTLSINKPAEGITVSAICYKRPEINKVTPYSSNSAEEIAKNTPIVLTFDHAISDETKDEIIVTYSAISNFNKDSYFSTSISPDKKTVTLTPIKMLPLEHAYETVTVTVPCQKVYYLASDGRTKITPADKDFSWSYRVNNSTLTKTVVRFATNDAAVTGRQINAAGTLLSSGTKQDMNVEQAVNLEFPVADGYKFAGWKVESATTGYTVEPEGYVTSGTIIVKNEDKSYFTLVIDGANPSKAVITSNDAIGNGTDGYGITVLAKDVLLPEITKFLPSSENVNPKDSAITIEFNNSLAPACSALLDLIRVTMNGNDVSGFFEKRELKNNVITIKNTSLLDVTGSATKKITVTVPAVFYYEPEEGFRAYLSKEQSFDYKIDSSTANKTKIRFDSSENSKKALKVNEASTNDGGTLAYNRGETVKLEYEVPAGYKFAGWKIVSPSSDYTVSTSDYVTRGTITVKNGDDTYLTLKVDSDNPSKAVAEIVDAIEDYETSGYGIRVLAKDVVLPVVNSVKINNTTSIYAVTSTSCDSKIYINFSKAIDTTTATLSSSGSINITKFGSSNSHYENYFTASWSSDKKQLVLSPKNDVSKLVPNTDDTFGFVITLNANRKEIKDTVGCPLIESAGINDSFDIPYTVNSVRETTKPLFYRSQYLYSSAASSTALSSTPFSSWGSTASYYTTNHIKDSVNFSMYGYDMDSGIKSLRITETYYKKVTGEAGSGETKVKEYPLENYSVLYDSLTDGTYVYTFSGTHSLQTAFDGVIKLDFQFVDNAENVSEAKTYYVIKDTYIDVSVVGFDELKTSNHKRVASDGAEGDSIKLTLSSASVDKYYGTYSATLNVTMKWGYSEDDISTTVTKNSDVFTFNRDPDKNTYVKIFCKDDVGNSKEYIRVIPMRPDIANLSIDTNPSSGQPGSNCLKFDKYNVESVKNLAALQDATFRDYKYMSEKELTDSTSVEQDKEDWSYYAYTSTELYVLGYRDWSIYFGYAFYYSDGVWCSAASKKYINLKGNTSDKKLTGSIVVPGTSKNSYVSGVLTFPITSEPVLNTGYDKITLLNTFDTSSQYNWLYKFVDTKTGDIVSSSSNTFSLPTPASYELYIQFTTKDGDTYTYTKPQKVILNSGTASTTFTLTDDTTPPELNISGRNNSAFEVEVSEPTDSSSGVYTNSNGLGELTYYYLPNSSTKIGQYTPYTMDELSSYEAKIVTYKPGSKYITLPYEKLEEGNYTVCVVAKDKAGNSKIYCTSYLNRFLNIPISVEMKKDGTKNEDWRYYINYITTENVSSGNNAIYFYEYNKTSNGWADSRCHDYGDGDKWQGNTLIRKVTNNSTDFSTLNTKWLKLVVSNFWDGVNVNGAGYYSTVYFYPGYYINAGTSNKISCKNKNIINGGNGVQVICDAPTFVHTVYCHSKITETNEASDISVWEICGIEVNPVFESESFTYGSENYEKVPKGMYYTTIAHFADGTAAMGEIKQKK